jgi:hypothetical protein
MQYCPKPHGVTGHEKKRGRKGEKINEGRRRRRKYFAKAIFVKQEL